MGNDLKEKCIKMHKPQFFSPEILPKICFANGRYVDRDRS